LDGFFPCLPLNPLHPLADGEAVAAGFKKQIPISNMTFANQGKSVSSGAPGELPILSFFTGLGLLDLGFHTAGFESVWHNEVSAEFIKGFNYGMASSGVSGVGSVIQNSQSIVDIGPNQILREAFGAAGKPDVLGMIGGPPCPDFSVGGKNRGHEGDRGRLSQVYVSRILEIRPTFFVFENVPGLLRTAKHREFLKQLLIQLSAFYRLDLQVVNALEYGVPQDRERLIIVGLNTKWLRRHNRKLIKNAPADLLVERARPRRARGGLTDVADHWMPWDRFRTYADAKLKYDWPDTNRFGSNPTRPVGLPEDLMVGPLICDQHRLALLPNGTEGFVPYSSRFVSVAEGDVSKKCFKRLHRWRFSPAAAYGNNEVHLHPTEPRRLTVREAMQIQTVPENFALPQEMTLTRKFKTIGNAVPVRLAEAVARSLKEVIEAVIAGNPYANI
jgi:DNA (cytosine-5)-methyltransferase 1